MTNSKKIRILTEYVDKGLGEQIVLIIEDRWNFDPEKFPRKYAVREQYTVADALNQFKEQKGYIYEGMNIKDLQKNIERKKPVTVIAEFADTREKFHTLHPDFEREQKQRLAALMGMVNKYKGQFVGV